MKCARPLALIGSLLFVASCAGVKPSGTGNGGSSGSGNVGNNGGGNVGGGGNISTTMPPPSTCNGQCTDFPSDPVGDDGTNATIPSGASSAFSGSGNGSGGPCLIEPQDGSLFPANWLQPRFRMIGANGEKLFEITISADNQQNSLVVWTDQNIWTMPKVMWQALATDSNDMPITVKVRGSSGSGSPSAGTTTTFTIAPVNAQGTMVYWSPTGSTSGGNNVSGTTTLSGFAVGDDTVEQVLVPSEVALPTVDTSDNIRTPTFLQTTTPGIQCVGCHTATPDGAFIAFNDFFPWGADMASGATGMAGAGPGFLGPGGYHAMIQPWVGMTTFSAAHWSNTAPTEHIMVAPLGSCGGVACPPASNIDTDQKPGLAWFDLESKDAPTMNSGQAPTTAALQGPFGTGAWNWIVTPTAGQYAAAPSWSHDGTFILYTGTSNVKSGRMGTGTAHLYTVPYSTSGPQTPAIVPGLDNDSAQYYGSLSADDQYIVFDQVSATLAGAEHMDMNSSDTNCNPSPCTWSGMYMQPATELFFVSQKGGTAKRLAANDPPTCPSGITTPYLAKGTMNNTWAKWSPQVSAGTNGKAYYWFIFSSWREGAKDANGSPIAQLYMSAVVIDETTISTFPAVYLWNQPTTVSNFTPAWDFFQIPIVVN